MPHCRKQETSDLSEFLADIAYFKLMRFTHLLFVLSREDKRNNPDGLDKRKNVEKLDGLRQSCHRQWHSRGGFFRERTIDTWRKWLNGWRMENLSLPVTYGQFLQRYLDNVCYFISEFFPYFSFKCNKERIITSCLSYIISFGLQQLNVF